MLTFVDNEKTLRMVCSSSNISHVKGWFEETVCGKYINYNKGWYMGSLTSLAYLGRIAQRPKANMFCAQCARHYKDVKYD